ncbi:MAG TPA: hypothetical protein VMQ52_02990 [Candidatus Saccharimonadales bacterium]|jgi:hypothetical protein|nr:hypothetical protein [Candidatus Saccharimonadales bacterium]
MPVKKSHPPNKNQPKQSNSLLKHRWQLKAIFISAGLTIFYLLGVWLFSKLVNSYCNVGNGCVSSLSTATIYLGYFGLVAVTVVLGIILLRRFVTNNLLIAVLAMILALTFAVESRTSPIDYALPNFIYSSLLLSYLWSFLYNFIYILIPLEVGLLIFRFTYKKSWHLSVIVCLILAPAIYFGVSAASNGLNSLMNTMEINNEYAGLPFTVYQPSFVAPGEELQLGGGYFVPSDTVLNNPAYYTVLYGTSTITEYKATADYNPPTNCGNTFNIITLGKNKTIPCNLIGYTSTSNAVYEYLNIGYLYVFTREHNTIVVFSTDTSAGNSPFTVSGSFDQTSDIHTQDSLIIQIFSSLHSITQQQAKAISQ